MKFTIKLFLVICLSTSIAFAEGELGTGGRNCTNNCFTENQRVDEKNVTETGSDESILTYIQDYLDSILGYFGEDLQ
jgi:hypothetical protein